MTRRLLFLCVFLAGIGGNSMLHAQEALFKALFMYNFTKDIEWPVSMRQGDFKIVVLGNSDIVGELEKIAQKKKVGNQPIVVQKVNSISDISNAHIVYLPPSKSSQLGELLSQTGNGSSLVITDKDGLTSQGACINYVQVNGKQKFEISPSNMETRGLLVNSFLLSLGIVID